MQMTIMALVGLGTLFVGWLLMFILPGIRVFAFIILALGAALVAVSFIVDFRRVKTALTSRKGKLGAGATVMVSLFVGIILFANAISVGNFHRFDFTGLAQFTLTTQTKEVLAELDKPVEVVSFFTPDMPVLITGYARDLLAEYQNYSSQLTVRAVDLDLRPDEARMYGIDQFGALYGAIVFRSDEGQRQVYGPQIAAEAEHAFTSAILEVTGIKQKSVYFLTGHGERSVYQDYANARSGLRDNLFQVDELDLISSPSLPDDMAALVIAGSRAPLLGTEIDIIRDYLDNDGRALILLDPNPTPVLVEFLKDWWISIEEGIVIDPTSHVAPNKDNPLVPRGRNSFQLPEIYFTGATATLPLEGRPEAVSLSALAWTSPEAWLDRDYVSGEEAEYSEDADRKGPLAIGAFITTGEVTGEEGETDLSMGTRIVVIGDSDFAANRNFNNGNNSDLFLSAVNWLVAGEEIISIDRKVLTTRRLLLDPEQARFLHISSIGLLPLILLICAGIVWWRKR